MSDTQECPVQYPHIFCQCHGYRAASCPECVKVGSTVSLTQERPVSQLAEALFDLEEELRLESQTAWGTWESAIALRKKTQGLLLEAAVALQASEERERLLRELCDKRMSLYESGSTGSWPIYANEILAILDGGKP